jgi:hypothetical protein
MMSFEKRVKVYGITIGVLILLAVLGVWFSPSALIKGNIRQPLLRFEAREVGRVEIGELIIQRNNSVWEVQYKGQSFPAMRDRMDGYLKLLQEATIDRVVRSGGDGAEFGITAETKPIVVKTDRGVPLFELYAGSGTPDGRRVYVRTKLDGPIYAVDRRVVSSTDRDLQSWVDNRVFLAIGSESQVMELELTQKLSVGANDVGPYKVRRTAKDGQEVWLDQLDRQIPDARSLVTRLVNMRAMSHALAEDWPKDFSEVARLRVRTEDNFWHELIIGKRDNQNRWPCEILGRKLWLGDWNFQDLKPEPAPGS